MFVQEYLETWRSITAKLKREKPLVRSHELCFHTNAINCISFKTTIGTKKLFCTLSGLKLPFQLDSSWVSGRTYTSCFLERLKNNDYTIKNKYENKRKVWLKGKPLTQGRTEVLTRKITWDCLHPHLRWRSNSWAVNCEHILPHYSSIVNRQFGFPIIPSLLA